MAAMTHHRGVTLLATCPQTRLLSARNVLTLSTPVAWMVLNPANSCR